MKKNKTLNNQKLVNILRKPKYISVFVIILIITIIGVHILTSSHAATPYVNTEAEATTLLAGGANIVNDPTASGGKAVKFGAATTTSKSHIMIIMMENQSQSSIIGNSSLPYINNTLTQHYPQATNVYATIHPSLPNYLMISSGTTSGITNDCSAGAGCQGSANLANQLDIAGISWAGYFENMPYAGYSGGDTGGSDGYGSQFYIQHHNPFVYYPDLKTELTTKTKPYTSIIADLNSTTPPDFVWISPNMLNNMHDGPMSVGDTWLSKQIPLIQATNWYKQNGQILLTWDESDSTDTSGFAGSQGGKVAAILISQAQLNGADYTSSLNQAGILRSIEQAYKVSFLNNAANTSNGSLGPLVQ
jgi:hypothetical protein